MKREACLFCIAVLTAAGSAPLLAQSSGSDTTPKTRTVCEDVTVQDTPKDTHQIAGMAIGGVAGGLLGNQIGGGKGKTIATVAGAAGGAYAGKKVQENQQAKSTHVERRCHQVTD
ncbi:glycine zipper 2TM domain-containing protein [Dyella solisilvae]|uniref:Glycine zipper 2TM domain-containing protein n=1 Tax=Dyella solisilvae TaxID=1920168 RepID=A0A370K994_9GAMM|nr:glycine zipper 2TM domain-containing protein [Dyella solisilvae]RDI99223.1 glycine zipper 2TM domain-containing protein [Dyella solisilvae]